MKKENTNSFIGNKRWEEIALICECMEFSWTIPFPFLRNLMKEIYPNKK